MDLFRKYRVHLAPLLSRLFTAMSRSGELPFAFNNGTIVVLYKAGDRTDPANYRSITLLNADYRAYARVLATRLSAVLPSIIDPQQTAFLGQRSMGETILLLQLLPRALAVHTSGAAAVSCDIRKAYDTVSRDFLQQSMAALGVGPQFRQTVGMILSNTRACASVNGSLSDPAIFYAGVRQGCPLAPLLYLFIGQALSCFLRAQGIGITIEGQNLSAAQFADDMTAFLPSLDKVPEFMSAMTTFGAASGQCLNPNKTKILLMGNLTGGRGPHIDSVDAGNGNTIQVVKRLTILGVSIEACSDREGLGEALPDWAPIQAEVARRGSKISRLPITAFARGCANSAYAMSMLLFQAEFSGLPRATELSRIQSNAAALVDHKRDPAVSRNGQQRRFHGISAVNQLGNPADGGFGVLPIRQHIWSRHAMWALKLVQGLAAPLSEVPPWVLAARVALSGPMRSVHPIAIFGWKPSIRQLVQCPPPLRRMFESIAHLPPLQIINTVTPGNWCSSAPLWHNPLLEIENLGPPLHETYTLLHMMGIDTLVELANFIQDLEAPISTQPRVTSMTAIWKFIFRLKARALWAALPPSWISAAAQAPTHPPVMDTFLAVALATLGWQQGVTCIPLSQLSVRGGTEIQLQALLQPRRDKQLAFEQLAHSISGSTEMTAVPGYQPRIPALLREMWKLKCGNVVKEPYWRLVLDAIPTAQRRHTETEQCSCGVSNAGRAHHFWQCPIAQQVVAVVDTELARFANQQAGQHITLKATDIWLGKHPAGVRPWLWQLVCMATIAAMESGRRQMSSLRLGDSHHSSAAIISRMGNSAVAGMWVLLADAASGHKLPSEQADRRPEPFLRFDTTSEHWVPTILDVINRSSFKC